LAELLIALAILGVIATFTVPKVLQAKELNDRYNVAKEVEATLAALTYSYALENNGCFPGNLTCNFNHATGAILDGKASISLNGQSSYDQFEAYIDNHLNFVEKGVEVVGNYSLWTLPNGATVRLLAPIKGVYRPGRYELYGYFSLYLNTSIAQVNAHEYSGGGVDTDFGSYIYSYTNGGVYGGDNAYYLGTGAAYNPSRASIFDWKEHPNDTCVAVGGTNCGM
jgi:hypothetical protein